MKRIILLYALFSSLCCCSVKEDRSVCPCTLNIDMTDNLAKSLPEGFERIPMEVTCFSNYVREVIDTVDIPECGPVVEEKITRGEEIVTGVLIPNRGLFKIHADEIYLNTGNQADSLYAFCATVPAYGEQAYLNPTIRKQFSTIYLECPSITQTEDVEWNVIGYSGGVSLLDLSALPGKFSYKIVSPISPGVWSFRMPRQIKADMILNLISADGSNRLSGIEIGRLIGQTGYDFNDEDMKDVHIELDIRKSTATITVEGWEEVFVYGLF